MTKDKIELKVKANQIITFCVIVVIVAAGIWFFFYYSANLAPVFSAKFEGQEVFFRADLREAEKIEVLPSDLELQRTIVKPPISRNPDGTVSIRNPIRKFTITFKSIDDSSSMGWYTVESTEIIKKLTLLYKGKYNIDVKFNVTEVQEYGQTEGSNTAPVIELVHPKLADRAYIEVDSERDVVTLHGGDSLKEFDRVTTKLMMVALGVDV